jgi:hypothetical protein
VILPNGQSDQATSTPLPTYVNDNKMVGENNACTCDTSTSSSSCETNILKEEEAYDRWRPNEESTSPRSSTLYATSHVGLMAKKEKNVASESESESESDSESDNDSEDDNDEINQLLVRLSKKDKLMMLKLIEKNQ